MESGAISYDQITASSSWENHVANKGRLHSDKAWSAETENMDQFQWLEIDLGVEYTTNVTKVATQGSSVHDEWVTKYKLDYSNDGANFQYYREPGQNTNKVVSRTVIKLHFLNWILRDKTESCRKQTKNQTKENKHGAPKILALVNFMTRT